MDFLESAPTKICERKFKNICVCVRERERYRGVRLNAHVSVCQIVKGKASIYSLEGGTIH